MLALLLLLAASRVELVNETYQIPASGWYYEDLGLKQRPAVVSAQYEAAGDGASVRMALLAADELDRLRSGQRHGALAATAPGARGALRYDVRWRGDYVLVIENQAPAPATVRLRIALDFPEATELSPQRQVTVVAISFLAFFAIVSFSARRLLRAVRR